MASPPKLPSMQNAPAQNPLDQLNDIHLPEIVSWWPLAAGWWILMALTIVVLWWAIAGLLRQRHRNTYRRLALAELAELAATEASEQDIVLLLRRTALSSPLSQVAMDKSVDDFLSSLNGTLKESCFEQSLCLRLNERAYQASPAPLSESDRSKLLTASTRWIKKHSTKQAKPSGELHAG
jgi:hypothetical protein